MKLTTSRLGAWKLSVSREAIFDGFVRKYYDVRQRHLHR